MSTATPARRQLALFEGFHVSMFEVKLTGGAVWPIVLDLDAHLKDALKLTAPVTVTITTENGEAVTFDAIVAAKKHARRTVDEVDHLVETATIRIDGRPDDE